MDSQQKSFLVAAALLSTVWISGGDTAAQCSGGGRGGEMQTGSPRTLATSSPYSQNPLASNGYPQGNLIAMQYQQRALAMQRQVANMMYQNAQRQRLASMQREAQASSYRLARAEAKRAARAERIVARLRQQGRSSESYTLTSINVDKDIN